jgi:hypothetical protein
MIRSVPERTLSFPPFYARALDASAAVARRQVFFVVGCQKSGTTWLQKLLDAHPAVCCGGEGHFADLLGPMMQQVVKLYNDDQRTSVNFSQDEVLAIVRMLGDQAFLRSLAPRPDPQRVTHLGDKTPEAALALPALSVVYPGAKFIHAIRDGRDGAVSGWAHLKRLGQDSRFTGFAEYAGYFAAKHWVPYIQAARQAGAQLPGRYIEVRYEAMIGEPLAETRRLIEFLGADPGAAETCVKAASFRTLSGGRDPGQEDARSHFRKGVTGEWRSAFDAEALERFHGAGGPLLERLGYSAAGVAAPCAAAAP